MLTTMRLTAIFLGISLSLAVQASWFGGDSSDTDTATNPYSTWTTTQLKDWLDVHSITVPKDMTTLPDLRDLVGDNWNKVSKWTHDQYPSAQRAFADVRDSSFDNWDESRLQEFLLAQGVVAPKGTREKLVLMAKEKYRAYTDAASSFPSMASATASAAIYGDKSAQVSRTLASLASQATSEVARNLDQEKDYAYSSWDESRMRRYLEQKGFLKTNEQKKKEELVSMMHNAWGKVANPIWEAWSDSYTHHWLVTHNIIEPDTPKTSREYLISLMQKYYYSTTDSIFHSWSDSQLKQWLIENNFIKSDAQVTRDKMLKMVEDNYLAVKDTFWSAWSDNQIHQWLVENGYLRSDAQKKRDELIKLADEKYNDISAKTAAYLAWPDARLRAYLRENGLREDLVPGSRPGLLQETRIRWVQADNRADTVLARVRELVNGSAHKVEDVLGRILHLLTTGWVDTKRNVAGDYDAVKGGYDDMKARTDKDYRNAKKAGEDRFHETKKAWGAAYDDAKARAGASEEWVDEKWEGARQYTGERVKEAGQKIKGEL